jgi:hypothetical protein
MTDDSLAYVAVTRLYADYADVVTRRAWDELEALFLPESVIHVDTVNTPAREFRGPTVFADFVATSIQRFEFFELVILNTVVRLSDTASARGRLYMVEVRQERETGEWSNAYGVYHDHLLFVDGRWRFAERHYQSLARKVGDAPAEVFPFPQSHTV